MDNDKESTTLFSKSISVIFRRSGSRRLDVLIQARFCKTYHRKELFVQLTDKENYFFLQTLVISEDDFKSLKNEQGLLVDFSAFGQKFIDLLENCIAEEPSSNPRFVVHFLCTEDSNSAFSTLEIVETNPFKHLTHLTLKFVSGSDTEVKNYLVHCLKTLKEEKCCVENKLQNTESDLSLKLKNAEKLLAEKTESFQVVKKNRDTQHEDTVKFYEDEIKKLKDALHKKGSETEERITLLRNNLEERYSSQLKELEHRLKEYEISHKDLTDQKYRHESIIRELRTKLTSLEQEKNVAVRDIHTLRRQNTNLDSDKHERDKTLNHLRTRIAVLEQEVTSQQHLLQKSNDLLETSQEQKHRLQSDLDSSVVQSKQFEENVKTLSSEVNKGNDIIQKLQENIKALKSKVKILSVVTTKQEKVIEEKDSILSSCEDELQKDKENLKKSQDIMKEEKSKNEELLQKLNEAHEQIKNNENVINWLNKQLTETSIQRQSSYNTSNSSFAPKISYNRKLNSIQASTLNAVQQNSKVSAMSINDGLRAPMNSNNLYMNMNQPASNIYNRPILKNNPQLFQGNGVSPIVPLMSKQPLREKQIHFSTPADTHEPILDPKYLMRKKPNVEIKQTPVDKTQVDENTKPSEQTKSVKPFPVSTINPVK